jgi:hypothetical protein
MSTDQLTILLKLLARAWTSLHSQKDAAILHTAFCDRQFFSPTISGMRFVIDVLRPRSVCTVSLSDLVCGQISPGRGSPLGGTGDDWTMDVVVCP